MELPIRNALISRLPNALIGAVLAAFYLVWLENETPIRGVGLIFVIVYVWVFFTLAAYLTWTRILASRLEQFSPAWRNWWLAGSLVMGFWLADNLPVVVPGAGVMKLVLFLSAALGVGLLLFALSLLLVTRCRPALIPVERRFRWLAFALPMIVVWTVVLLAFWPGLMSADSLDQWGQVLSGQFTNHHPAFHTFTIWLLTRVALSPAVVAIAQILALALVTGALLAYIETLGVASRWLWLASILFAISPVNATMVNTLWKDIPYSVSILALSYLLLRAAVTQGRWLETRTAWLVLGVTAVLAALFRHNGVPVAVASLLFILVFSRRHWKPVVAAVAVLLVLFYVITGPVYRMVGVTTPPTALGEAAASLYNSAATADPGSPEDEFLLRLDPLSDDWQCAHVYGSLQEARRAGAAADQPENVSQKAVNLLEHAPSLLAYDYRCNRSLIWIVWDPNGELRNPSHAEYGIDANAYGLRSASLIPPLQQSLANFVRATAYDPSVNWLVWRPALYLYLFLLVIAVAALRRKSPWLLLVAVPVLLQSISMTLVTMPPNFRYHYPIYLAALAFWPLLFLPCAPNADAEPSQIPSETGNP